MSKRSIRKTTKRSMKTVDNMRAEPEIIQPLLRAADRPTGIVKQIRSCPTHRFKKRPGSDVRKRAMQHPRCGQVCLIKLDAGKDPSKKIRCILPLVSRFPVAVAVSCWSWWNGQKETSGKKSPLERAGPERNQLSTATSARNDLRYMHTCCDGCDTHGKGRGFHTPILVPILGT